MKKLLTLTSVFGIVAALGACSGHCETQKHDGVTYTQTHVKDDVTRTHAKMYQVYGDKSRMGEVEFKETDNGLKMTIDMHDMRPGIEYKINARGMDIPAFKADAKGKVEKTFIVNGLTAAELKGGKIALVRDGKTVGQGDLK